MRVGVQACPQSLQPLSALHLQNPHPGPPLKGEGGTKPSLLCEPKRPK